MADLFNTLYDQASTQYGLPKDWLPTFARIESGGNPQATTGSYKGLFQLSGPEFTKYGGQGDIYDPQANTFAAASKLKSQSDAFKTKYGRDPTASDLYLIHQQGEGGYAAHTANPDRPAWQNMLSTAEGQQKGAGWAKQAIWGNVPDDVKAQYGSVDNITSKQFADLWANKVARFSGAPGAPATLASTLAQGGTKMPDPVTGEYTPEDIIQARRRQAQLYQAEPVPGGKFGPLAGAFQGIMGGITGNQADTYSRSNQKMLQDALRGAAGAPDVGRALLASPVPALQSQGMGALLAEQQRLAQENMPSERLKREAAQQALDTAKSNAPLNRQLLEAQVEQATRKDALEQFLLGEVGAPVRTPGAPQAPQVGSPIPAPISPPAGIPGVSVAPPLLPSGPAPTTTGSAAPATPAAAPQSARELLASRTPAERLAFLMAYKKDPGEAAKMLQGWADPNAVADKEAQKQVGEAQGKAKADLPSVMATGARILRQVDDVANDPGLAGALGPINSRFIPTLSQKTADAEAKISQLGGAAFLQAYNALKGSGQISEVEGAKATAAMGRIADMRQSEKGYRKALQDFRDEVIMLQELAYQKAGAPIPPQLAEVAAAIRKRQETETQNATEAAAKRQGQSTSRATGGAKRLRYNPETGELAPVGQ